MKMSEIPDAKYLSVVIEKPQSGKTFICTKHIQFNTDVLHFIFTMNTIISNKQFCNRVINIEGNQVCLFNSSNEKINFKDKNGQTINVDKAKDKDDVVNSIIKNKSNIIIMCAHYTRLKKTNKKNEENKNSVFKILERLNDSLGFHKLCKKIHLHIDEAHEYVPINI